MFSFLSRKKTSIDVGTFSIKVANLSSRGGKQFVDLLEIPNTLGYAIPTSDVQVEKMRDFLNKIVEKHKIAKKGLSLALPENVVSTQVIAIPYLTDSELASSVSWQAEQYIPIPKNELSLEYKVLYRPDRNAKNEKMRVLLIGARRNVLNNFTNCFTSIGLQPNVLETQALALVRAAKIKRDDPATIIAHIGANNMILAIVHNGEVRFIINHPAGSEMITKTLITNFGLTRENAENYKMQYGMVQENFEGKLYSAILPMANLIINQIKNTLTFFNSKNPDINITRLMLSGGGGHLNGFPEFLVENLGLETILINPFDGVETNVANNNPMSFAVNMGLLLR